ncbi:MAG: hypothetical protein AAF990_14290 [Bacteroidota bacterium]
MNRMLSLLAVAALFVLFSATIVRPPVDLSTSDQLMADSIIAYVYRYGAGNPSDPTCSVEHNGDPVANVRIKLRRVSDGQLIDEAVTDADGRFALLAPNPREVVSFEPCFTDENCMIFPSAYCFVGNGITTFDAVITLSHVYGNYPIDCPALRVAADFDFNAQIDTFDVRDIQRAAIRIIDDSNYDAPVWRLIPNILNRPYYTHPDAIFTSNFWTFNYPEFEQEHETYYPFDAQLNLLGTTFTYDGPHTWRDTVEKWEYYAPNAACGLTDYGFRLVKSGDLNGDANLNFNSNCSPTSRASGILSSNELQKEQDYNYTMAITQPKSSRTLEATERPTEYELKIKVKCQEPLRAYQLGLSIDPNFFEIQNEKANRQPPSYSERYQRKSIAKSEGYFTTSWINPQKKIPQSRGEWQEIFSLRLKCKTKGPIPSQLRNIIQLKPELISGEFITDTRMMTASEVTLVSELVPVPPADFIDGE